MNKKYLLEGPVLKSILILVLPLFISNLMQQFYNIADTIIVGKFIGSNALAAVGSSFTFMVFLTSIIYGLCLGSGSIFSIYYGENNEKSLKQAIHSSFVLIIGLSLALNLLAYLMLDNIIKLLNVPSDVFPLMKEYLIIIFSGIIATTLFNFTASVFRSLGDSKTPMIFLSISVILNIILDLVFVNNFQWGISGAAIATVISQYLSGLGLFIYAYWKLENFRYKKGENLVKLDTIKMIGKYSVLTSLQQSIMNFGILMIQGLVNSFGTSVMAAFTAGVKIDAFAYIPVQDFGNAFSIFVSQNYGAKKFDRIKNGFKLSVISSAIFSAFISIIVYIFAPQLIGIFLDKTNPDILAVGVNYLRTEGAFYIGIGWLFLLYGYYRAIKRPNMSVILTIFSLGTRVLLAYLLSPTYGTNAIWWAIIIGWFLADLVGFTYYFKVDVTRIEKY
ncbi:MATE family efflux transporter [Helcococcus kunzii]